MLGFFVLGGVNAIAGLLLLTQPETLNTLLPDTIEVGVSETSADCFVVPLNCHLS